MQPIVSPQEGPTATEGFILHSCFFFHNLRGYDSHILMQSIGKNKDMDLKVIPNTMEKYIAFFLGNLKFFDSYQFMGASSQKLVTYLAAESKDKFQNMMALVQNREQQDLLLRREYIPTTTLMSLPSLLKRSFHHKKILQSIARRKNQ